MKSSEIFDCLETCVDERRPFFIWGPPGIGKSDIGAQLAKKRKIGFIDFRLALRDPTDIKGFPMPDQATKTMKFYRDAELPTKGEGILWGDEMNSGTPSTQAAFMQLTLKGPDGKHRIGDYVLPDGWSIGGAGNREGDRGVVHRMPSPLANRFTHLELEVDADDWVDWALRNGIAAEDIAFIRFRPNLLFTFDPKSADRAFATPRSWVAAMQLRAQAKNPARGYDLVKGTVGEGPAAEYVAFLDTIKELPSVDEIKLNPDGTPVPAKPATLYALTTALSMGTKDDSTFTRFMPYIKRMPAEFQAVYVKDSMKNSNKIKLCKAFVTWSIANEAVIC